MVEKVNLDLIKANSDGSVVSEQKGLVIKEGSTDTLNGSFDRTNGQLSINIPNVGSLLISGLPTINDIGYGPSGATGKDGADGINGLMGKDGLRGVDGCSGARGSEGVQGKQGVVGPRGKVGPTGATGPTGAAGAPGAVEIYVQATDPAADREVGVGAIWVKD